eukprot:6267575-Amphidinium_carterae.1
MRKGVFELLDLDVIVHIGYVVIIIIIVVVVVGGTIRNLLVLVVAGASYVDTALLTLKLVQKSITVFQFLVLPRQTKWVIASWCHTAALDLDTRGGRADEVSLSLSNIYIGVGLGYVLVQMLAQPAQ